MKKNIKFLFALVMLFSLSSTIVSIDPNFTPVVYAQEKAIPEDIFDKNYSDDYVVFSESSLINRFVNEIRKNFEVEGVQNNLSPLSEQSVLIRLDMPSETRSNYDMNVSLVEDFQGEGLSLVFLPYSPFVYENEELYEFILKLFDQDIVIEDLPADIFELSTIDGLPNSDVKTHTDKGGKHIFLPLQDMLDNDKINNPISDDALNFDLSATLEYAFEEETHETEEESVEESTNSSSEFNSDDYEILTYEEIMRDRDGKMGTPHTFYAEVMQYMEDDSMAFALLMRNGDINQLYQAFFLVLPDSRLVEGDNIDVYGLLMGLEDYETVIGGTNTTPYIMINKVLIEGIDY